MKTTHTVGIADTARETGHFRMNWNTGKLELCQECPELPKGTIIHAYGAKEITTYGPRRAAAVYAPDGSKALVMPAAFASNVNDCYYSYNTRHISDTYEKEKDKYLWLEVA